MVFTGIIALLMSGLIFGVPSGYLLMIALMGFGVSVSYSGCLAACSLVVFFMLYWVSLNKAVK